MRRLRFITLLAGAAAILFVFWQLMQMRSHSGEREIASFSGEGRSIDEPPFPNTFTVNGPWEIHVECSDTFGATVRTSNGEVEGLIGIGDRPGSFHSPRPGTYHLRISTRGTWTARVVEVSNPDEWYYGREETREKKQIEEEQHRLKEQIVVQRSAAVNFITPLPSSNERVLKPKDTFKECSQCPEMIVVPPGSFIMGSDLHEPDRMVDESPQHMVVIAQRFAVGKFAVTFDEWDTCVADGGCDGYAPSDRGWGRGRRPVINVNWGDGQAYVAWLSRLTGKAYRLLTEVEFEYAARARTTTAYFWGDEIGKNNANCDGCGSQWDDKQTAPVGSFAPNTFGLYDIHGNVWQWLEDCYHENYDGSPADGSAWIVGGKCRFRGLRGGSWLSLPRWLRSAQRFAMTDGRGSTLGFRVARALSP